jgi:hypothetical protein
MVIELTLILIVIALIAYNLKFLIFFFSGIAICQAIFIRTYMKVKNNNYKVLLDFSKKLTLKERGKQILYFATGIMGFFIFFFHTDKQWVPVTNQLFWIFLCLVIYNLIDQFQKK